MILLTSWKHPWHWSTWSHPTRKENLPSTSTNEFRTSRSTWSTVSKTGVTCKREPCWEICIIKMKLRIKTGSLPVGEPRWAVSGNLPKIHPSVSKEYTGKESPITYRTFPVRGLTSFPMPRQKGNWKLLAHGVATSDSLTTGARYWHQTSCTATPGSLIATGCPRHHTNTHNTPPPTCSGISVNTVLAP